MTKNNYKTLVNKKSKTLKVNGLQIMKTTKLK